jgi:hypothetical protein
MRTSLERSSLLIPTLLAGAQLACIMPGQKPALASDSEVLGTCGGEGLLDDGEDNNNQGAVVEGRGGYWYTYVDDAGSTITPTAGSQGGTFTMSPGGANGSKYAARFHGKLTGGTVVFGAVGLNLVDPKDAYDASKYTGVAFWAKKGPGAIGTLRFKVPDANTDEEGGRCKECFNDFGATIELTEGWKRYVVPFKRMKQEEGWGAPRPRSIDRKSVYGLQWQVSQPGASFDVWIDDVELLGCQ